MAPGIQSLEDLSPEALVLKHYREAKEDQKIIQNATPVDNIKYAFLMVADQKSLGSPRPEVFIV